MNKTTGGYAGNILRVNLTSGKITKESVNEKTARKFLGCTGYATKILWDELKPGIDPLSPENKLLITAGPLAGTRCPGSDSLFSCFKSPLTNCWGESRCGGGMGTELKKTGFDIVIIEGASQEPVYLWIHDGEAEIKPAGHLWGRNVPETRDMLKGEVNEPKSRVACIGPAGERLIRFASVMVEDSRALGRCGAGAVMGSKKLKAVVFHGGQKVSVANPDSVSSLAREMVRLERQSPEAGKEETEFGGAFGIGTVSYLPYYDEHGETPTKYGASNSWGRGRAIYESLKQHIIGSEGCLNCVVQCGLISEVKEGKWKTPPIHGPEYETTVGFAHYMLNDDVEAVIHANYLCNIYGMDTISCSNVIAFAMECYDKGWINKADTDGIELTWGNMDATKAMMEKIVRREGFGKILGEGVRRAAVEIGKEASRVALHVKGLELPFHDPRCDTDGKAWALQYGTANRGMCHVNPHEVSILTAYYEAFGFKKSDFEDIEEPYSEIGKGKIVKWAQDYGTALNLMGLCNFHSFLVPACTPETYAAMLSSVTGWEINPQELLKVGERVFNLQRCFNIREGIRRKDDLIPERVCQIPAFGSFSNRPETAIKNYEAMLDEYYEARGWDKHTGIPTSKKLKELELAQVAGQFTA